MKKSLIFKTLLTSCFATVLIACGDDPDPSSDNVTKGNYVIGVSTDAKSYLLATDNLLSGKVSVIGNGTEASESSIHPYDNGKKGFMFLYRKGDPATMQSCNFLSDGIINVNKTKTLPTREEFVGYFKEYLVAMTSVTLEDGRYGEAFNFINGNTENVETLYLSTENVVHQGEYANMGGLISVGEDMVSALEPYRTPTTDNSSTTSSYQNEMNVIVLTKDGATLKVKKTITDERASFAVGRRRSGRLSCMTVFDEHPFSGIVGKARSKGDIKVKYYRFVGGGSYIPSKTEIYSFSNIDVNLNNLKYSFPKERDLWTLDIKDYLDTYNFYLVYNPSNTPSRRYNFYRNLSNPLRFGFSYPSSSVGSALSGDANKNSIKTNMVDNILTIELNEFRTDFIQANFAGYIITGEIEIEFEIK